MRICAKCGEEFGRRQPIHIVDRAKAEKYGLKAGDYHKKCCPLEGAAWPPKQKDAK